MKAFKALLARALNVSSEAELNQLCADIDWHYQHGKIKADENQLLYKLINKLHSTII